jgi:glycolate oxidase
MRAGHHAGSASPRRAVVARGAGTGLSGGALPVADACLLVLTRLNRILEVDPRRRIARLEPGVPNLAISRAAAPHGLYYAPDPSSQLVCSIGGNVAENSGGVHCLKYGMTFQNLLEVRFVTAEGELVTVSSAAGDAPGLPLLALLCGSEGMLGVIVEVTVRLLPRPETTELLMAAFDDVATCAAAVARIIAAGVTPSGLEMMDGPAIRAWRRTRTAGTRPRPRRCCSASSTASPPTSQPIWPGCRGSSSRPQRQRSGAPATWPSARSSGRVARRPSPPSDGSRRITTAWTARSRGATCPPCSRESAGCRPRTAFRSRTSSHGGDGNLHPLIMFDAGRPGDIERAERVGAEILELCIAAGGTVTGEHGVGVEKLGPMCSQFGGEELAAFHAVKRAFDPRGLLNPGKAVPTLARCADYGALRVQGGRLPFPDLPRF